MSWGVEGINYPQEGIFGIAFFFLSSMNVIESPTFVFAAFHSYKGMICTWHFVFLRSCAAEWFDIRVCCGMITEIGIIDTPITSHPGHRELSCVCVCVCVCVCETRPTLNNFQVSNTILLTVFTMVYIGSSKLPLLITENAHLLSYTLPHVAY